LGVVLHGVQAVNPAPYPADTRAKGWRFELDYEQIEQSSTWSVAKPAARPWLLMMWMLAWKQVPCGSWPADEEVIAGALGIDEEQWALHRKALMRGWTEADDGRLYHPTITKRVIEMLGKRRSDSDRQAAKRAREAAESTVTTTRVTPESRVTQSVVGSESSTDHRPPKKEISKASPSHPPSGGRFAEFWSAWPKSERKQDKKACAAKWKLKGYDAQAEQILADIAVKRETTKWQEGYIEGPLVYLNNERWLDGVTPDAGKPGEAAKPWHQTRSGIVAKGVELGLGEWDEYAASMGQGEQFQRYEARVLAAAGHSPRAAA
jgi:hypothetical protein